MFSQAKTLSSAWDCIPIHFSFHFSLHSLLSLRLIIVNPDDRLREIICKFSGVFVVVVVFFFSRRQEFPSRYTRPQ